MKPLLQAAAALALAALFLLSLAAGLLAVGRSTPPRVFTDPPEEAAVLTSPPIADSEKLSPAAAIAILADRERARAR